MHDGYEIRTYDSNTWTWMGTTYAPDDRTARRGAFMGLFGYIKANNISMTIPVPKKVNTDGTQTMYFYIPMAESDLDIDPDKYPRIEIHQLPTTFYVRAWTTKWLSALPCLRVQGKLGGLHS